MSTNGTHAAPPPRRASVTAAIPAVAPPRPRIAAVIRNVAWVGIAAHAGFIPMFALLGHPRLAAFNVLSVAMWIAAALARFQAWAAEAGDDDILRDADTILAAMRAGRRTGRDQEVIALGRAAEGSLVTGRPGWCWGNRPAPAAGAGRSSGRDGSG